ncbi:MAG: hypothetical protein J6N72_06065 [Psychrobacter sp.]|nr:hypothetical protein [Psychrobacter sp.]
MTTDIKKVLPAQLPNKNPVFIEVLNPIGFKGADDYLNSSMIDGYLAKLPSLTTISHAIAKSIPTFTQKNLVVFAQIRNSTYNKKKMQVLFLTFTYDTLFYGHLSRKGFLGVFYDKPTQSIGIDVQSEEAIAWINENLNKYFQVVVNLTTHQFMYQDYTPALRPRFASVCNKIQPVTLWLNQLTDLMKKLDPSIQEITKIELHNGDRFIAMPANFFLVCHLDKLLVKIFDKKGWFRYLELSVLKPGRGNVYTGVKNKEATKLISRYMDTCNYYKVSPYTVKESKRNP